ncbi:MAG TPA: GNAT family N-acetyltransferase, partial [Actinospica sp.]|nr:GNAT family N-acetyltransferase [Actinospica sp.]
MNPAARLLPAAARPGRVELRRMRWWDIPGVILLEHLAFPDEAWSVGMFWSELAEAATRYYLVAEEYQGAAEAEPCQDRGEATGRQADGHGDADSDSDSDEAAESPSIIGYAGLLAGVGEAEVLSIAVDPAREGRGLGAVLLTELM